MNEMKKQPFVFLAIPTETPHQPITTCTVPSNIRRLQSTIPMASLAGKRKRGADEEAAAGGSGPSQRSGNTHAPNPEDIDLTCPISLELFENPVVASDGNTYSRAGIEEWFRNGHHNSPLTQERLELTLYPNRAVAKNVQKYKTTMGLKLIEIIERCPNEPAWEGLARDMIEEGSADLNARRELDRRTPLLVAAENGLRGIVDILVRKGADDKAMDRYGKGVNDFLREEREAREKAKVKDRNRKYIAEIVEYKKKWKTEHPGKKWDGNVPSKYSVLLNDGTKANVGTWLNTQKQKRKKRLNDRSNTTESPQEKRLNEIGILWEVLRKKKK